MHISSCYSKVFFTFIFLILRFILFMIFCHSKILCSFCTTPARIWRLNNIHIFQKKSLFNNSQSAKIRESSCYSEFFVRLIYRSDFRDFAELCFKEFGDRVKYWITLNEPQKFTGDGYDSGHFAPGRCSKWVDEKYCINGNSSTEPYIVAHNLLLSHAAAVHTYWEKYQVSTNCTFLMGSVKYLLIPMILAI